MCGIEGSWYATFVVSNCANSPPGTRGKAMFQQHFMSYEDATIGEGQEEEDDEMEVDRPVTFQVR